MSTTPVDIEALAKKFGGTVDSAPIDLDALAKKHGGTVESAQKGLITSGNIDLTKQPRVKNADGTSSTVRSMSFGQDGKEILVPTVAHDGSRILSDDEAIEQYRKSGKHLGIFDNPDDATAYAQQLHKDYESGKIQLAAEIPAATKFTGNELGTPRLPKPQTPGLTTQKMVPIGKPSGSNADGFTAADFGKTDEQGNVQAPAGEFKEAMSGYGNIAAAALPNKKIEIPKRVQEFIGPKITDTITDLAGTSDAIGRGVVKFIGNQVSPEALAETTAYVVGGEALPVVANLPMFAKALADLPKVAKALDLVSKSAVPLGTGVKGAADLIRGPKPETIEDATEAVLNALMLGVGVATAAHIGKTVLGEFPKTSEAAGPFNKSAEITGLRPEEVPTTPAQKAAAEAKATELEASGQNIAAAQWKKIARDSINKPISIKIGDIPAVLDTKYIGADGTISEKPFVVREEGPDGETIRKPAVANTRVIGLDGKLIHTGTPGDVAGWLQQRGVIRSNPEAGGAVSVSGGAAEVSELPTKQSTAEARPLIEKRPGTPEVTIAPEALQRLAEQHGAVSIEDSAPAKAADPVKAVDLKPGAEFEAGPVTFKVVSVKGPNVTFERNDGANTISLVKPERVFRSMVDKARAAAPATTAAPAKTDTPAAELSRSGQPAESPAPQKEVVQPKTEVAEPGTKHEYSSTQVNLPESVANAVKTAGAKIPDDQLAKDGREDEPHITLKYGLHGEKAEEVEKVLAKEPPITAKLGRASIFSNDDQDVLKVDVESPDLHRLNAKVADALPHTDTHPDYTPHVTIAYLKKGEGKKYEGEDIPGITGKTVTFDSVKFSGKNGDKSDIHLNGKIAAEAPPSDGSASAATEVPSARVEPQKKLEGETQTEVESVAPNREAERSPLTPEVQAAPKVLLTGSTFPHKVRIRQELGGTWDKNLKGWIVPADKAETAKKWLGTKVKSEPYGETKDSVPEAELAQTLKDFEGKTLSKKTLATTLAVDHKTVKALEDRGFIESNRDRRGQVDSYSPTASGREWLAAQGKATTPVEEKTTQVESLAPAEEKPTVETGAADERPAETRGPERSTSPADLPALGEVPAEHGEGSPSQGETGGERERGSTADVGRDVSGDNGGEAAVRPGMGETEGGLGVPAGREGSAEPTVRTRAPEFPSTGARDYVIQPSDLSDMGGKKTKAKENLEAIRTMKRIEAENRAATPEEQKALIRYVGWGGISDPFKRHRYDSDLEDYIPEPEWQGINRDMREVMTPDEYASARASTTNAHYTSPLVVGAMWDAMRHLGLKPESLVLEPSMGVGHFFGLMPADLAEGSRRAGIELDNITGRIATLLYPQASVHVAGFEQVKLPNNFFDLAISNVPFGNYPVIDSSYKRTPIVTKSIHDYFFAKALDKVRPGGIVAFITSSFTMDKKDSGMRRYLAGKADLVGAIRLPNTAFRGNAGTDVTTDIIFLQKRAPQTEAAGEDWAGLGEVKGKDGVDYQVNQYYAKHPEMMLGQMVPGKMYADSQMLAGELNPENLAVAISKLPANAMKPWEGGKRAFEPAAALHEIPGAGEAKDGGFFVSPDGVVMVREGDTAVVASLNSKAAERVKGMIGIRDAIREVFRTQREDADDATIKKARTVLNKKYDAFVKEHGPLSTRENQRVYAGDPDLPLLLSVEDFNASEKTATKAPIFSERTIAKPTRVTTVETPAEALAVSLAERGRVDWTAMQELTGKTPDELQKELADGKMIFRNPQGRKWETAEEYLSGNVRKKLEEAKSVAKTDARYKSNVEALEEVQPVDLTPGEIRAKIGAPWIPAEDVAEFARDLFGLPKYGRLRDHVNVNYLPAIASWVFRLANRSLASNTSEWGTSDFNGDDLIEGALNSQDPTVYRTDPNNSDRRIIDPQATLLAREKQRKIAERFEQWVWEDGPRAERLAKKYNEEMNNLRLREYDGSHLTLPGLAAEINLRPHQKNAIWRAIATGNTLLAHVVGAGKTFTMAATAMEMRRLGLARKPMFVVPNHLVEQWGAEFLRLYPTANILVAGKEHFQSDRRKKIISRIATGNYDAVIVSHKSFEFIPMSREYYAEHMQKQIQELTDAMEKMRESEGKKSRSVKELEKAKKRLEAKLEKRMNVDEKDNTTLFEELGVDHLFVDEAQAFKNLYFVTKMTRIAGLPNTESNRAFDMYLKTQYVSGLNGGHRGVEFATGTPVMNTMAELYTMQRYLQTPFLREQGIEHFDAWAKSFGDKVTGIEMAPDGSGFRMNTRFSKFVNLPELMTGFKQVADIQTADMLNLPVPKLKNGKVTQVIVPASDTLRAFVKTLVDRAEKIRAGQVDPRVDNMLKITGDGRKAALDIRLVMPGVGDEKSSKINIAVKKIHEIWKANMDKRLTQMVFIDLSTPKGDGAARKAQVVDDADQEQPATVETAEESGERFQVYDDIAKKLVKLGVPRKEIVFIHDAKTDAEKQQLFDDMNAGRKRILLGSTEKMGAGTNAQRLMKALHHLDAPWRPGDVEQRDGRIRRQGNTNEEIEILRYGTEPSFDAYMWQTLTSKAGFISQVMRSQIPPREMDDVGPVVLDYADMTAAVSGNPQAKERIGLQSEIKKLESLKAGYQTEKYQIQGRIVNESSSLASHRDLIEKIKQRIKVRDANPEKVFIVGKKKFSGEGAFKEAGALIGIVADSWKDDAGTHEIGSYRGFPIIAKAGKHYFDGGKKVSYPPEILLGDMDTGYTESDTGRAQRLENALNGLDEKKDSVEQIIDDRLKKIEGLKQQAQVPFEMDGKIREMKDRLAALEREISEQKPDRSGVIAEGAQPDAPESLMSNSERGAAPFLGDLAQYLHDKFKPEEVAKVNYSGLGSFQDRFLPGGNLSQIEQASHGIHTAALRAASSSSQSRAIIANAVPQITKALKDSTVTWDELRLFYMESRLQGIADRWRGFAEQAADMSADELKKMMTEGGAEYGIVGLLKSVEGRAGMAQNLAQTAEALTEAEDWETLAELLEQSFNDAASRVTHVMYQEWFDSVSDAIQSDPGAKKADALYADLIEKPLSENHALNEGVFSTALGPANRYYPLVPIDLKVSGGPGRRLPYTAPKNIANRLATGLSEGYDATVSAFANRLAAAFRSNDKAALLRTMEQFGWLLPDSAGQKDEHGRVTMEGPDGEVYAASREESSPARLIVKGGKVIHVPAVFKLMPQFMARELKPILAREPMSTETRSKVLDAINTIALAGPADFVFHTANLMGALVANTPFLGTAMTDKALSVPLIKRFAAMAKVLNTETMDESAAKDFIEMAKIGILPSRFGTQTISPTVAKERGAKLQAWQVKSPTGEPLKTPELKVLGKLGGRHIVIPKGFGAALYGPKGIDARARLFAYRLAKEINPDATPQEIYHFVNILGNYTPELQGEVERALKATGWSPFFTAGSTMIMNGMRAWTGTGPMPKGGLGLKVWQMLTGGALGTLAAWAILYEAFTGKNPLNDKRAKLLSIPVGGGDGWIDKYRYSAAGKALWGDGPEVGYINVGFFSPLVPRGARAMGLMSSTETSHLGGTGGQVFEAAVKDILNSFAHPALGPGARALFVGVTGAEPYLTGLRDRGRMGPQLMPAVPDRLKPGFLGGLAPVLSSATPRKNPGFMAQQGAKSAAALREMNSFWGAFGEHTGFLGPDKGEKGSGAVRMIVDLAFPNLIQRASNPYKRENSIKRQAAFVK